MILSQEKNKKHNIAYLYMFVFFLLSSCNLQSDDPQDRLQVESFDSIETTATVQNSNQQDLLLFEEYIENPEPTLRLYTVHPDGTELKRLIEFSADYEYWVSPNNRYVALFSLWGNNDWPEQTLVIIDLESGEEIKRIDNIGYLYTNERQMYFTRKSVAWSPTGDKILFERNAPQGTGSVIWAYDLATTLEKPLTPENTLDREAAWSNDGQYAAYVSTPCEENNNTCGQLNSVWNISVVKLEDRTIETLTSFPENHISFDQEPGDAMFCNLNWSPNDQFIAFENQCLRSGPILNSHRVFVVDLISSEVKEVVKFEQPNAYSYSFHWVDNNNLLTGYSELDYLNFETFLRGGIIRFDLKENRQVHTTGLLGFSGNEISWVPGKLSFIAFSYEPIFQIPQDGQLFTQGAAILGNLQDQNDLLLYGEKQNLPFGLCHGNVALWSVEGQYVAYSSIAQQQICNQDTEKIDIIVLSADNGRLHNITESLEGNSKPISWIRSN